MNIGVCGTGTIASWTSDTIAQLADENIVLYTCATSPGFECEEFAKKFGFQKVSASFDELMADPEVDLVYIGMPNNFHYPLTMKAIEAGKNVVCEKPFSVREDECAAVLKAAEEKGVFVSEALWQLFLPSQKYINEEIAAGTIGAVQSGEIVMLDNIMFLERAKKLETGGGVILDEGPYTFGFMTSHFGTDIASVESTTRKLDTGVDAEDEITVKYRDGRVVHVHQRMDTPDAEHRQYTEIVGAKGKICTDEISNPMAVTIYDLDGNVVKEWKAPPQIRYRGMPPVSGYEYEWKAYEKALREGKKECAEASHEMTRTISHIISTVLKNAEIVFPF